MVALCSALSVVQAALLECLSFEPFPSLKDGFVTPEVDVGGDDVVDAHVIPLMIVKIDEGCDLRFKALNWPHFDRTPWLDHGG